MTKKIPALMASETKNAPMTFAQLKEVISVLETSIEKQDLKLEDVTLGIRVEDVSATESSPLVDVISITVGFDADRGKCIVYGSKKLREIGLDELSNLKMKYNTNSLKQFEYGQLEKKYDKLLDQYNDLKFLARTHGIKIEEE